ncbi:MAG: DUF721 domain-containing protein [Planctomycetes bacterium]|nr:DUF721 domain-containing protein [Planctomycetota bacterium]
MTREQRRGEPLALCDLVQAFFNGRGWTTGIHGGDPKGLKGLQEIWREMVGPEVAAQARPTRFRDNRLEVVVTSPALRYTLDVERKQELLDALRRHTGVKGVRDIRFTVGKIP